MPLKIKKKAQKMKASIKKPSKKLVQKEQHPYQGALAAGGGALGAGIGSLFGNPGLGAALGSSAGDFISRITGWGAYKVNKNSLMDGNTVPTFAMSSDGTRVCHREYIADINGSSAFTNQGYSINPSLASTFPWLSQLAVGFEEWEVRGLVFEYRPTSGSAVSASSSALGVVVFATDYNVNNPNFSSKQAAESYEFSSSTVPFEKMLHPVECAPGSNVTRRLFTRNNLGDIASGGTQSMYDLGTFQVITQGMQSAYTVGELWVSYDIFFTKPRINPQTNSPYIHFTESPAASATAAAPLGTTAAVATSDSTLLGIQCLGPTKFLFYNPGYYLINAAWSGASITGNATFSFGSAIVAGPNILLDNAAAHIPSYGSATANLIYVIQVLTPYAPFVVNSAANTITVGGLSTMVSGTLDLFITPLPLLLN